MSRNYEFAQLDVFTNALDFLLNSMAGISIDIEANCHLWAMATADLPLLITEPASSTLCLKAT
jgi:hypothetical protein